MAQFELFVGDVLRSLVELHLQDTFDRRLTAEEIALYTTLSALMPSLRKFTYEK